MTFAYWFSAPTARILRAPLLALAVDPTTPENAATRRATRAPDEAPVELRSRSGGGVIEQRSNSGRAGADHCRQRPVLRRRRLSRYSVRTDGRQMTQHETHP